MLKIKDATGKVVGILKDDDDAPEMVKKDPKKKDQENKEETEDAGTETTDV